MPDFKKHFIKISKSFYKATNDTIIHDGIEHAGYLSFLAILSFFPFLVFLFSLISVIGDDFLGQLLISNIVEHLPESTAKFLTPRINEIVNGPPQNILTIAILGAVWTASSSVEGIKYIFNRAYRVKNRQSYFFSRVMSIIEFMVIIFLLISTVIILIITPIFIEEILLLADLKEMSRDFVEFLHQLTPIISIIIWFFTTSFLYYYIPNLKQKYRYVLPGALAVVILWLLMSKTLIFYLTQFDQVNIIYGSLASFIIAMLFFYLMAMILVFGAEFNYAIGKEYGYFKDKNKD